MFCSEHARVFFPLARSSSCPAFCWLVVVSTFVQVSCCTWSLCHLCLSNSSKITGLHQVFELFLEARSRRRELKGHKILFVVQRGTVFWNTCWPKVKQGIENNSKRFDKICHIRFNKGTTTTLCCWQQHHPMPCLSHAGNTLLGANTRAQITVRSSGIMWQFLICCAQFFKAIDLCTTISSTQSTNGRKESTPFLLVTFHVPPWSRLLVCRAKAVSI